MKPPYVTTVTHGLELIFDHHTRMRRRAVHDEASLLWNVAFVDRRGNVLHVAEFLTQTKAHAFVAEVEKRAELRRAAKRRGDRARPRSSPRRDSSRRKLRKGSR
ncbi:MAG: hypothetical protein QM817_16375 [Archangium sp.]